MIIHKKIYIFPLTINKSHYNKYVYHFAQALNKKYDVINLKRKKNIGIFDLLICFRAKTFIFNWTENLNTLKYGKLQVLFYLIFVSILKLSRKNIIWIFHNKQPHDGKSRLSRLLMRYNAYISNTIITHAKEGVEHLIASYQVSPDHIIYLPHPVYPEPVIVKKEKKYDIIIWGNIEKYKRILDFLHYWIKTGKSQQYKLLVCGKCNDKLYSQTIEQLTNDNIIYQNEYLSENELNSLISESKIILFTYNSESVLSSGALIYSLPFRNIIIGPAIGAFKDLANQGLIHTYNDMDEILNIIETTEHDSNTMLAIDNYLKLNTWDEFIKHIECRKL